MEIRVLYVEDNPSDVELFVSIVETSEFPIQVDHVETMEDIKVGLKRNYHLIVCDFNLRGFNGLDVLEMVRKDHTEIPVIFFSSTVGDEKAVNLIHLGATDFVLKDNITKIPFTIDRAYRESQALFEKKRFENELKRKNDLLNTVFDSLADLILLVNDKGEITTANVAFCHFFKTTLHNIKGKQESEFLPKLETDISNRHVLNQKEPYHYEMAVENEAGETRVLETVKSPMIFEREMEGTVSMMRDITVKMRLEEEKQKDQYLIKQAEELTLSGSFEFDEENDIFSISPNFIKLAKLKTEKNFISYKKFTSIIYQEDLPLFEEKFFDSVKKQINFELEHRYLPVGETNFRYCRTVVKPYADKTKTVFYGIIQDNTVNREASLSLLNIQEEEREKISKELHDNVGQKLSASSMFFDSGGDDLPKAKKLLDESIGDIRSLSRILTTSVLGGNTFSEAVDFLLENTPNSDIISVDISVEDSSISEFVGGQLYRILQEGLNNTMKYSKATSVHIKFFEERNFLAMSLEDNGVGFNMDNTSLGNGLRNMKERVRNCNGEFEVNSQINKGTIFTIKIPIYHA